MTKINFIFLIAITLLAISCGDRKKAEKERVIWLKNNTLQIGVLNKVGGRLVFFGPANGINLLKQDTGLWNKPDSLIERPNAFTDFKPYYGMITWLGPQSEWWKHQDINKARHDSAAVWPPDPYIIYGEYKVSEKSDSSLTIVGPKSPVSGIQLTKKFVLSGNSLKILVIAKNISDTIQSWDLWSNSRFNSYGKYAVPCSGKGLLRISSTDMGQKEKMDYTVEDGIFSFVPKKISEGKTQQSGKAFIYPEAGNLLYIGNEYLLKISFEKVPSEKIHPEQALVEVFQSISNAGGDDLLELEHHSAYTTLKPGESFQLDETWMLLNTSDFPDQQAIKDLVYKEENNIIYK